MTPTATTCTTIRTTYTDDEEEYEEEDYERIVPRDTLLSFANISIRSLIRRIVGAATRAEAFTIPSLEEISMLPVTNPSSHTELILQRPNSRLPPSNELSSMHMTVTIPLEIANMA